ncbi:class I SAM-dependent methyltransferase [Chitinophaga qingshengii]|uniref:Class I SAM-dependent methyltransferase n=1 Tax=Chitinophaga qingshengii TaxID=1569794 RepID=A0ABR7TQC1_9BACT|nr:class I SAM-dependent methyltransferase [Chitinophaga qingshengii]MBC9932175.1 class I SAM-dependent methyltransferase [Chitinophaga qingshengii]
MIHTSYEGSIPAIYNEYLAPVLFDHYAQHLAAYVGAIRPERLLEIGCGTGIATRRIVDAIPENTEYIVTDLIPDMLDFAKAHTNGSRPLNWQLADVTALPFDDKSFDTVISQLSVMFFDRPKAFREVCRVLQPGGHFIFSTWDKPVHNPLLQLVLDAVEQHLSPETTAFYRLLFAYNDLNIIESETEQAGFSGLRIEKVKREGYSPTAHHIAKGLIYGGPMITTINEINPALAEPIVASIEKNIAGVYGEKELHFPLQALVVTAVK